MRFRVIAKTPADFQTWLSEQQQGPGNPLTETDADGDAGRRRPDAGAARHRRTSGASTATSSTTRRQASYGPNLTHLASRTTFASGTYPLNRAEPHQLGEGRALDDPDVVAGLPAPTR